MSKVILLVAAIAILPSSGSTARAECGPKADASPSPTAAFSVAPTATSRFRLRAASGAYLAGRAKKAHEGVDIVATASSDKKLDFRVFATGGGKVAFVGNSDPKGYGFTIIIDHQNGEYSLYAHLAEKASNSCVSLGNWIAEGDVIGFVHDPKTGEGSSGNAQAKTGVKDWERLQVHVELIMAPKDRSSKQSSKTIKDGAKIEDPTSRLVKAGYSAN